MNNQTNQKNTFNDFAEILSEILANRCKSNHNVSINNADAVNSRLVVSYVKNYKDTTGVLPSLEEITEEVHINNIKFATKTIKAKYLLELLRTSLSQEAYQQYAEELKEMKYLENIAKNAEAEVDDEPSVDSLEISKIFVNPNKKAIALKFEDGYISKAQCMKGDKFDILTGIAIAFLKAYYSKTELKELVNASNKELKVKVTRDGGLQVLTPKTPKSVKKSKEKVGE